MRLRIARLLVIGSFAAGAIGCASHRGQGFHADPFGSTRFGHRSPSSAGPEFPPTPPPRLTEVTQAGNESFAREAAVPPRRSAERDLSNEVAVNEDLPATIPASRQRPIRPRSGDTLDHAPDYSWLQGRLEHSALGGGVWKVRYAPLSADDEHGGSVILESPPDPNHFQPGDMVYIEGQIVSRQSRGAWSNPVYRVQRINLLEE